MLKQGLLIVACFAAGVGLSAWAGQPSPHSGSAVAGQDELPLPGDAREQAPETFRVQVETTQGPCVIEVTRSWSPHGADRFYNLVKIGYFQDIVIFRAIDGFMFQFGIHGEPEVNRNWKDATIPDDPAGVKSNLAGTISFAKTGAPNSRSVQFFVNTGNNSGLDKSGFTPFGIVVEGADVLTKINTEYGENSREVQSRFQAEGNRYILAKYPNLDRIKSIQLIENK